MKKLLKQAEELLDLYNNKGVPAAFTLRDIDGVEKDYNVAGLIQGLADFIKDHHVPTIIDTSKLDRDKVHMFTRTKPSTYDSLAGALKEKEEENKNLIADLNEVMDSEELWEKVADTIFHGRPCRHSKAELKADWTIAKSTAEAVIKVIKGQL